MTKAGSASPRSGVGFLRASSDFQRVFRQGTRRRSGGLVMIEAPADHDSPGLGAVKVDTGRVGIVATRKVGNAVARNRAKRRLRAAFREIGLPPGKDYVVIASKSVVTAPFAALLRWVEQGMNEETHMEEAGNA